VPYNHLQYPTDLVLLVVLWRLRYTLSLRDVAEMFLDRGFVFSHEAVRDWEARCAPLLTARLRAKRRGTAGVKWHADETYVKVNGAWCYLYRAIDRDGNLVDAPLSERRDMDAARRFFARALGLADRTPEQVTTDGHDAYPRAIRETLGRAVIHRTSRYKTIGSSRITGRSNSATTRCAASETSPRRPASAPASRNSASTSAPLGGAASTSPSRIGGASSRTAGRLSWPHWPPPDGRGGRFGAAHITPWPLSSSQS